MRKVLPTREEADERPPLVCDVIANRAAQHRVMLLERIEHRALRNRSVHVDGHLFVNARECSKMLRKRDADHRSVCTSTDSTGGRSRTIANHVSPASADAYTCPPVVPKYTPLLSSESTAIASRRMFT